MMPWRCPRSDPNLMLTLLGPSSYASWHVIDSFAQIVNDNKHLLVNFVILVSYVKFALPI